MINIAIDGPSGAGKSTIAQAAAKRLGYLYVDTGALYRSLGLHALRCGADPGSAEQVVPLLPDAHLTMRHVDGEQRVFLGDDDVSEAIRTPEASMASSAISAIPAVREFLLDVQRDLAKKNNVIMDGRDIGTVILPDATYKIYLTASDEVRAKRRMLQLQEKGIEQPYEEVLADIRQRDYNDTHREVAPLRKADDAIEVCTDDLTLEESIQAVLDIVSK